MGLSLIYELITCAKTNQMNMGGNIMIKGFELTEEYVQFFDEIATWEEAVQLSANPLLKGGEIKQSYIDGMIESVKEHGPYIVIAPNIALPHARPETGSVKIGFSVMKLKKPVSFLEDGSADASLFIALSCVDADTHLEMLQEIVMILSDQDKHDAIFAATTKEEMLALFNV
jgi:PTS system ascorbate-specific IIA component